MSFDEGFFIDNLESFPCIWDTKLKEHKDKVFVENAWKTIALIMEIPVNECQDLWKSLRAKYVRERKMIKNMPSGSAAYTGFWEHFKRMGFLSSHIQIRRTKGNILKKCHPAGTIAGPSSECVETLVVDDFGSFLNKSTDDDEYNNESQIEDASYELTESEDILQSTEESDTTRPSSSHVTVEEENSLLRRERNKKGFKRKRTVQNPGVDELLETCTNIGQNLKNYIHENNSNESEKDFFFLSLRESFLKIKSEKKKLLLKAKILTMIAEEIDDDDE
ncbi:unnamed protein product [Brassicogethes aeneus]|uniref:MADF domain-containing protein n=1 Tax=Brassicogethes aeneus TaxID=1431903 RepID=A0A9P0B940_BRAAE|nr:unnamed protein product [Brassicogethes aeneus]